MTEEKLAAPDKHQPPPDQPLSINEFCESVGCGKTFTYGEINAGRLIAHKFGRLTKILPSSLANFSGSLASKGSSNPLRTK